MEFSIEILPGWKVADNAGLKAFAEKQKQQFAKVGPEFKKFARGDEVDSPLLMMGEIEPWKGGRNHRLIYILCTDVSARPGKLSGDEFLNFVARMSAEYGLSPQYNETLEQVMLGGHEFWKAHFTQATSIVWYEAQFVTIEKKHVVQFVLISPDEEGLHTLEPIIKTVHFEGHAD